MYTTGPFLERLFGDHYLIGVVNEYIHYYWILFTKMKSKLPKIMEEFFEKVISRGTSVKYLRCDNSKEH